MENIAPRSFTRMAACKFLQDILIEIERRDPLHSKQVTESLRQSAKNHLPDFNAILNLIYYYFKDLGIGAVNLTGDYLRMVGDMRREMGYFMLYGKYSCGNQDEAYQKIYSKPEIMRYYMNALVISQLLWSHHFNMLMYFKQNTLRLRFKEDTRIMDIGAGHGLFTFLAKKYIPRYKTLDIVDISASSIAMTKKILGKKSITYHNCDIADFQYQEKYHYIILGEVLEHLDYPKAILWQIRRMLADNGVLWITVPVKAPAIDHVYLFKTPRGVLSMIEKCGFKVKDSVVYKADKMTSLVGAFCVKQ